MKKLLVLALICLIGCTMVQAQRLMLEKKHPSAGGQWDSRFGLTGKNKPEGFIYRLRQEVQVPNLQRSETTKNLELFVSEPTDFGTFALYRNPLSADSYNFTLVYYNKAMEPYRELDLCKISGEYEMELQDIRYENGKFYFNMACPSYARGWDNKCSRLYRMDAESGTIDWRTDYLVSNDVFIVYDKYVVCGYGFTDEKDYVYLLDKETGKVYSKILLASKSEYIEEKDGKIYVIDYADNVYVFSIK